MKKKTGLFSGSFNPIHMGHLILANYLCEFAGFDEIWISVSPHNPLKEQHDLLSNQHRVMMVQKAIEQQPKLKYTDVELTLPTPSYTIVMLDKLRQQYPDREFCLIIGADNWLSFDQWHDYHRILSEYRLCVYPRKGCNFTNYLENKNVMFANTPLIEISSTFIRNGIESGKNMCYFLPEAIYSYIIDNNLYKAQI